MDRHVPYVKNKEGNVMVEGYIPTSMYTAGKLAPLKCFLRDEKVRETKGRQGRENHVTEKWKKNKFHEFNLNKTKSNRNWKKELDKEMKRFNSILH